MSLFLSCMSIIKEILTYLSKRIPWRLANKNTATNLSVSCANCGISLRNCSISSFSSSNIWSGSNPSCHYTSPLTSISQQCTNTWYFSSKSFSVFFALFFLPIFHLIHWNKTKWVMWFYQTLWYLENSNTTPLPNSHTPVLRGWAICVWPTDYRLNCQLYEYYFLLYVSGALQKYLIDGWCVKVLPCLAECRNRPKKQDVVESSR